MPDTPNGQNRLSVRRLVRTPCEPMRALILLIPLLAGCAHPRPQFDPANFRSPGIERCLEYWTANFSHSLTNAFYVYATETDQGELARALVFWREGGRLLDYVEMPPGTEAQAWRLRPKVDRDAVFTDERIGLGNDLVPHRAWMRSVRQCITRGLGYEITLDQALAAFPNTEPAAQPQPAIPANESPAPSQ